MSPSHQESIKLYSVSSIEEAGKHRVQVICIHVYMHLYAYIYMYIYAFLRLVF